MRILADVLAIALCATAAPPLFAAPDLLQQGISQESRLDLLGARETYREALSRDPRQPGLLEHAAWFLYLNGFHDRECLGLLEQVRAQATDPQAVSEAISRLKEELGLSPMTLGQPAPKPLANTSDPPARMEYARELFWAHNTAGAEATYQALLKEFPEEPSLLLEIARVEIAEREYARAASHLAKARSLRSNEPEIALEQARLEALQGHRNAAIAALGGVVVPDEALKHLAYARAYHYAGEFPSASREYRAVLAKYPYLEEAAYGLAETDLRTGAVPEARQLISSAPASTAAYDWTQRRQLYRETAAPQIQALAAAFVNSLHYQSFDLGLEARYRPEDPLELTVETTHGWYDQTGFSGIQRQTGAASLLYQPDETYAVSGFVSGNSYTTGWTSVNGGVGLMLRPAATLKLDIRFVHVDLVDSEPPFGLAIYDLAATIGAVGVRETLDEGIASATWEPLERVQVFGKFRDASISDGNRLSDFYLSAEYSLLREPALKFGYGFYRENVASPAPSYQQGVAATGAYYDPKDLGVQDLHIDWAQNLGRLWSLGLEGFLYQYPANGGDGVGSLAYLKYAWLGDQAVRLDARAFDQDRGLNRNGSASGYYSALNFVLSYERSF